VARFVATDFEITVNGTDLSANIASAEVETTANEVETSSFGSNGFVSRVAGLKDASVTLSFHQDYGASSVHQTLFPLLGSEATVVIKPTTGAISATNPSFTIVALCTTVTPISGQTGDLSTFEVTWPLASGSGVVEGTA